MEFGVIKKSAMALALASVAWASETATSYSERSDLRPVTRGINTCFGDAFERGRGFSDLYEYSPLGDPNIVSRESMREELTRKIRFFDRCDFARFAWATFDLVKTSNASVVTEYDNDPYAFSRTVLNCADVKPEDRELFLYILGHEFRPNFGAGGKSHMVRALSIVRHPIETVTVAKNFFDERTSSYERSLIWSGLGAGERERDPFDVFEWFGIFVSPTSIADNGKVMSYEHQGTILGVLSRKDIVARSVFVETLKPLTDLLTPNGKAWTVTKLADQNPEILTKRVDLLIAYVKSERPNEEAYLDHIGALFRVGPWVLCA